MARDRGEEDENIGLLHPSPTSRSLRFYPSQKGSERSSHGPQGPGHTRLYKRLNLKLQPRPQDRGKTLGGGGTVGEAGASGTCPGPLSHSGDIVLMHPGRGLALATGLAKLPVTCL